MITAVLAFAVAVSAPECIQPSGSKITAADIAAVVPEYGTLPGDLVLGYAPQPGATRVLAASELTQWLARHGVQADVRSSVCFRWKLKHLDLEEAAAAMLRSLPENSTV